MTMNRRNALKHTALLLGGALSSSTLAGVLSGCGSRTQGLNFTPQFLTKEQAQTVSALVELILPKTDTPGANEAGVPEFIDLMLAKYLEAEEKELFMRGLTQLETAVKEATGGSFAEASKEEQVQRLTQLAEEAGDRRDTFFGKLRELTLSGYFTSELVGKNVLNYDPIPGELKGCIPIEEVGNVAWTI